MKKSFTLIEMVVSVAIVAMLSVVAVVSLGPAQQSVSARTGADEVKSLLDELRSYSVGPAQERAANYILIIRLAGGPAASFCNASGTNNRISRNGYMICYTYDKKMPAISNTVLNNNFSRVRGGTFQSQINISDVTNLATSSGSLVFNARTYDNQLGYKLQYFDSGATANEEIQVTDTKNTFSKKITVDPILNLITLQ